MESSSIPRVATLTGTAYTLLLSQGEESVKTCSGTKDGIKLSKLLHYIDLHCLGLGEGGWRVRCERKGRRKVKEACKALGVGSAWDELGFSPEKLA